MKSAGEVGYPSRVSGKGKADPSEIGRGKHSPPASPERVTSEALSEGIPAFTSHELRKLHIPRSNGREYVRQVLHSKRGNKEWERTRWNEALLGHQSLHNLVGDIEIRVYLLNIVGIL